MYKYTIFYYKYIHKRPIVFLLQIYFARVYYLLGSSIQFYAMHRENTAAGTLFLKW